MFLTLRPIHWHTQTLFEKLISNYRTQLITCFSSGGPTLSSSRPATWGVHVLPTQCPFKQAWQCGHKPANQLVQRLAKWSETYESEFSGSVHARRCFNAWPCVHGMCRGFFITNRNTSWLQIHSHQRHVDASHIHPTPGYLQCKPSLGCTFLSFNSAVLRHKLNKKWPGRHAAKGTSWNDAQVAAVQT